MTNELKFFDPETGAELHRVPQDATIPKNTPYGYTTQSGAFNWRTMGCTMDVGIVRGSAPHFTREPIAPPLPTEPGLPTDPHLDLKPFRHPSISGKAECPECGHPFEMHGWLDKGSHGFTVCPFDFTPTEPETHPLPTPGDSPIIASIGEEHTDVLMAWSQDDARWVGVDDFCVIWFTADDITEWEPMTAVPTETWDRLRVLDPEDTRDRMDTEGCVWRYGEEQDYWESENGIRLYSLGVVDRHYGPLRFADEVSDQ